MNIRELTCIGCPMGCQLRATLEDGVVTAVTGNTCPRGDAYARKECVHPERTVTGTVRVLGGPLPVVPVPDAGGGTQGKGAGGGPCAAPRRRPRSGARPVRWSLPTCAAPAWPWWPQKHRLSVEKVLCPVVT